VTVLYAVQRTDECNMEYEAQLNIKREKMRQQQKHLDALWQNIVQLNHQLETSDNKGVCEAAASRTLRQNANYRSLPLGVKPKTVADRSAEQNEQRTNAQHCWDMVSTQTFDVLTTKDDAKFSRVISVDPSRNPTNGNNVDLSVTVAGEITSSCSCPPVNSTQWSQQTVRDNSISHSENLRNTSYRMIGRFVLQQADTNQSKQSLAACLPTNVDQNTLLSSSGQKSVAITDQLPVTTESMHMKLPLTVSELEETFGPKDVVCPSPQLELDEVGSLMTDISSPLSRLSVAADGQSEPVSLPDVVGYLSDNVTSQDVMGHDTVSYNGSTGTSCTLSVSAASKILPPVAQKQKFQYPNLSGYGVTSCNNDAVSTQPNVTALGSSVENIRTSNNYMPYDTGFTIQQDLLPEKHELMLVEDLMSIPGNSSQKETFSIDTGQDLTDLSKLVDRPVYKPSVTYPVRRRLCAGEGSEFLSTCPSSSAEEKTDTANVAEDSVASFEGSLSKVQTVKNKLQVGMSRKVQFEPLALLLDAALEGEIDLLQTTLKV